MKESFGFFKIPDPYTYTCSISRNKFVHGGFYVHSFNFNTPSDVMYEFVRNIELMLELSEISRELYGTTHHFWHQLMLWITHCQLGVDDEKYTCNKHLETWIKTYRGLLLGIIDFMRQYIWDKHLETLIKASGILGGSKIASPTIVSPKQYKKKILEGHYHYFLTLLCKCSE